MHDVHSDWLFRMEAKSRVKQETFMSAIASRLGRDRIMTKPAHPNQGAPKYWDEFEWPMEERIVRFTGNFIAAGGHVARLANVSEAGRFIANKAEEMKAKFAIRNNEPELNELELEKILPEVKISIWNTDSEDQWIARSAGADFGVVMADYAAAYTGSISVLSGSNKGRSVSLLPTALFVIVPVERIGTRLGDVLIEFNQTHNHLPAAIHFISGPSRSADIENDLTIGVHGPGIVYAIIVG